MLSIPGLGRAGVRQALSIPHTGLPRPPSPSGTGAEGGGKHHTLHPGCKLVSPSTWGSQSAGEAATSDSHPHDLFHPDMVTHQLVSWEQSSA